MVCDYIESYLYDCCGQGKCKHYGKSYCAIVQNVKEEEEEQKERKRREFNDLKEECEQLKYTNDMLKRFVLQIPEMKQKYKKELLYHIDCYEMHKKTHGDSFLLKDHLNGIKALGNKTLIDLVLQEKFEKAKEYLNSLYT